MSVSRTMIETGPRDKAVLSLATDNSPCGKGREAGIKSSDIYAERKSGRESELNEPVREIMSIIGRDMAFKYVDRECASLFGLLPEEMAGRGIDSLLDPIIAERLKRRLEEVFDTKEQVNIGQEEALSCCNSASVSRLVPMLDKDGSVEAVLCISRQAAPVQREDGVAADGYGQKFHAIFDASPDMICITDRDGTIMKANRAMAQRFSRQPGTLAGKNIIDFMSVTDPAVLLMLLEDAPARNSNQFAEVDARAADGSIFDVEIYAAPFLAGSSLTIFICRDITARKRGIEMLRRALAETQKRQHENEALKRSAYIALEQDNIESAACEVLALCRDLIGVSASNIFMLSEDGLVSDELEHGVESLRVHDIPFSDNTIEELLEQTIQTGMPAYANQGVPVVWSDRHVHKSILFAPVSLNGKRLALLVLADKEGGFTGHDIGLVSAFCAVMATAFDRASAISTLKESEERFRTLFEKTPIAIAIARKQQLLFVNNAYLEMFGHDCAEDLIGTSLLSSMAPGVREEIADRNMRREAGEKIVSGYETFGVRSDGVEFPIFLVASKVVIGGEVSTVSFFTDLSEVKKKENEIRESGERFRRLTENAPDIILRWSPEHGFEYISPALTDILGYDVETVVGDRTYLFTKIHPDDIGLYTQAVYETEENNEPSVVEFRAKSINGEYKWLEARIIPIEDDDRRLIAIECILRDVNERKLVELETRRAHEFQSALNKLLHLSASQMAFDDKLHRFLSLLSSTSWLNLQNRGAVSIAERNAPNDLVMKASLNMDDSRKAACARVPLGHCICGKAAESGEIQYAERYGDASGDAVCDERDNGHFCIPIRFGKETLGVVTLYASGDAGLDGKAREFLESAADVLSSIIQRQRSEDDNDALYIQLLQAQKMEAVGTLAGGIAHDYNNMLAVIMGNAQLTLMGMNPGAPGYAELKEIESAATRTRDLTMKLLTFARKEKVHLTTESVNAIIPAIVSMFERGAAGLVGIEQKLSDNMRPVSMDINQIQQTILNILNNSRDAMPGGGVITLRTYETGLSGDICDSNGIDAGEYCVVEIIDSGEGIPKEVLPKIFEPFFTTKEVGKGTGLGLSTAFGIIKNHGGCIEVESIPGAGTTARIFLPLANNTARMVETELETFVSGKGHETILVVDDEPSVTDVAAKILKANGYRVIAANGGADAVRIFKKRHKEISLVLVDMIMPEMDGREVFNALKKIKLSIPVVLASGFSVDAESGRAAANGFSGFVQKPFTVNELCGAVRSALDKS